MFKFLFLSVDVVNYNLKFKLDIVLECLVVVIEESYLDKWYYYLCC